MISSHFTPITIDENIKIRKFTLSDVASLSTHANNRKIYDMVSSTFPYPYTIQDAKSWVEFCQKPSENLNLGICFNDKVIGGIGLRLSDTSNFFELGYWLGEEFWNKGIITNSVKSIIEFSRNHLDIKGLSAYVLPHNHASIKILEKTRFQKIAYFEKNVQKEDVWLDRILYHLIF